MRIGAVDDDHEGGGTLPRLLLVSRRGLRGQAAELGAGRAAVTLHERQHRLVDVGQKGRRRESGSSCATRSS